MQVLFARWASQRQSRIVAVGVFLGLAAIGVNRLRRGTALPHNADSEVAHPVTGGEPIEFDPKLTAPWWYFGIDIALIAFLVMVLLAALRLFNSILPPSEDIVTPWIGGLSSCAAWPDACAAAPTYPLSRQVSRAQDTKAGDWLR